MRLEIFIQLGILPMIVDFHVYRPNCHNTANKYEWDCARLCVMGDLNLPNFNRALFAYPGNICIQPLPRLFVI